MPLAIGLICLGLFTVGMDVVGQEPNPPEKNDEPTREQTIYIPYNKLRDVFEREGRGVFLPYEQFQKLWQEARAAKSHQSSTPSPVNAILVSADSIATIEQEVVVVRAELQVELMTKGWQRIPLQLNDAAVQSATMDGQPTRILHDPNTGYALLVENKNDEPTHVAIQIEYAKAYQKMPGQNTFSVMPPQAPINRWRIRIPDKGVKVQVEPMLATSEVPTDEQTEPSNKDVTEVFAFVGAAPSVSIRWVPKADGTSGMTPLASTQTHYNISVEEGTVRTTAQITYTIDRAELSQLTLNVPKELKIINVFDANVRKWNNEPAQNEEQASKLVVELFEPAKKTQSLVIEMEMPLEMGDGAVASIRPLENADANRQQGLVAIKLAPGIRAEPTERRGLMQMDPAELPPTLVHQGNSFAYRFTSVPFELKLKLDKVLPSVRVSQALQIAIEPQAILLDLATTHKIENAGVFQLQIESPLDYELLQVAGRSAEGVEAASIESYRMNDAKDRITINLNRRALGSVGLRLQWRKKLDDPNLVSPTGTTSKIELPTPRAVGDYIQWVEGMVLVHAPAGLRINPVDKVGVRDGIVNEFRAKWNLDPPPAGSVEVLSFMHAMEPLKLSVEAERKKPFITVQQFLSVMVEPGAIKFRSKLNTNVLYSSIPSLRIDVPESLASSLRIETQGIRESTINPPPTDVSQGYVAWSLVSDTPWIGNKTIELVWQQPLSGLEVGKQVTFDVPRIIPRGTDQAWGQIVLERKESIDLQTSSDSQGLRPIDPRYDLMSGEARPNANRAFEFQSGWNLQVIASRYALEQVKQTSIERAFARVVVTRSKQLGVNAFYRIRNASQRLALSLPEGAEFDSQPLTVNGQAVSLERGTGNQLFIPLAGTDPNQAVVVELRYTMAGDHRHIELPSFPDAPAVQVAYLGVFLPKERVFLASKGPWTDEFRFLNSPTRYTPYSDRSADELVAWVKQETAASSSRPLSPTEGEMYLFSSLRPEAGAAGALRLWVMDHAWWASLVIGALVLLGLLFAASPIQQKLVACAAVLTAILLVGVFAPNFSRQLLQWPLMVGSAIALTIWICGGLVLAIHSYQQRRASNAARVSHADENETIRSPGTIAPSQPSNAESAQDTEVKKEEHGGDSNA